MFTETIKYKNDSHFFIEAGDWVLQVSESVQVGNPRDGWWIAGGREGTPQQTRRNRQHIKERYKRKG